MPLYKVTDNKLEAVKVTTFSEERLLERKDLQRLLKADISALGSDLLVLAEEFGEWDDSNRRIDLLCLDRQARLVVVEIKRTEDGGHMELQAIRYAAMVSSMTLDQAVLAYAKTIGSDDAHGEAAQRIAEFLGTESIEEAELTDEVRIVLVAANFSTELTTSVMWLNKRGIDMTCIRLKPYRLGDEVVIDVTQIIPLPEAEEYEVRVRMQAQENKKVRTTRQEIFRRFWAQYIERSKSKTSLYQNKSTSTDHWIAAGIGRSGFTLDAVLTENRARVECYISLDDRSKSAFRALLAHRTEIESKFGEQLDWQDLPTKIGCRICKDLDGGWKTPESQWPELQDRILEAMDRLERALKPSVIALRL